MEQDFCEPKNFIERAIDRYPPIVPPNTSTLEAIAAMSNSSSSYVLVGIQHKVLGIFTERDVVKITANKISLEGIPISQVMTRQLITLNIAEANDIFSILALLRSSQIRHLPITDEDEKVVGVITPQSLRAILKPSDLLQMRRVREIMTTEAISVSTEVSVFEVARQMATHRKSCIVICQQATTHSSPSRQKGEETEENLLLERKFKLNTANQPQKPIGIITERDIVKFKAKGLDIAQTPATAVMSSPLVLAQLNFTLWQANQIMQQHSIRRLVVVDERGYLAGIITQSTLLQALDPVEMYSTVQILQQTITETTQELKQEVAQRKQVEEALRDAKKYLKAEVLKRTLELTLANAQLQQALNERIEAEAEVRRLNAFLEQRVQERTAQLQASNQELQQALSNLKSTQEELIQAEKMAALGQLIAGIAHEINTPLGAIRASISNISTALEKSIRQLPQLFEQLDSGDRIQLFALLETVRQNPQDLSFKEERQFKRALKKELEAQGIEDADAIASTLIKIGITQNVELFIHLLHSPNYKLILEAASYWSVQQNNVQNIIMASERASKIVLALKNYARQENFGQMTKAKIAEGIDIALTLYRNQLKQGIEVIKNYQDVPAILCYPEGINQIWTNLIHNAIQAMNGKGKLRIDVSERDNHIVVQFTDSGCGIPPEIKDKIFTPFFTTKPHGEGSGLGLHITHKIIDEHHGKIELESEPGRTTFRVWLPIK
ncbi:CBS domain-containing protein [Planktothrix sp. FACHB-1355]|uniref:histidine kinase n=1 Tax=Aerosakkonema funiforme FACHB-1375 TaxID=2949571 RepID=A0A926V9H3_9CYAN|nr:MULTISPECIES: CBS domain-containing protein [Oscillatoriales]MBD2179761.1 CBS domain-containing protein [Aerosakkonema funiforme FACHB-1375]MBD3558478.1 CBS domain-containing protein [Planktothrix sp. FACHB-1355]